MVHWLPARAVINENRGDPQAQEAMSHQLPPFWIHRLNKCDFLGSIHILHLILSPYGRLVIRERLIIDTLLTIVSVRERALVEMTFVLCHPPGEVDGAADIEHRVTLVCHNVSVS